MKKSVIIIGAGLGGLFAGAILSKEGYAVTVVEKNATIGGGLQSFHRFGAVFDTGMHVVAGMRPGGNIRRICNYLGILPFVNLLDVDDDCTDRLYFEEDHAVYNISQGRDRFVERLAAMFPAERDGLRRYVDDVYAITDDVDLFHLRPSADGIRVHGAEFLESADAFIARHVADRRLRSVLAYMNPLYGGRGGETPAFVHAIISTLYINGASRFVGGSQRFADLLAGVIVGHGGHLITGDGVARIDVEDRHVTALHTLSGLTLTADHYIAAIHPCTLLDMMPEKAFPKSYRERLRSVPNAYSAFSLYIKFREGAFPYINHSEYFMTRYDDIWNFGRADRPWPMGFLMMTPPPDSDGAHQTEHAASRPTASAGSPIADFAPQHHAVPAFASTMLVTAPMRFDAAAAWEHTLTGRRGADYREWKRRRAAELLECMERVHPGIGRAIEHIETASPLTIRDYYGVKDGTISGFSKDCNTIALSQLPVVTKVDNLLLTGQNNSLHGFCGVPLTAINTCEALLGRNYVINRINACHEE